MSTFESIPSIGMFIPYHLLECLSHTIYWIVYSIPSIEMFIGKFVGDMLIIAFDVSLKIGSNLLNFAL